MFRVTGVAHASLVVADTARSLVFYRDLLGLPVIERPDLGFPGAWLDLGGMHLHLLEVPNPDPVSGRPRHGGRDRHLAVHVRELEALAQSLDARAIAYTRSRSGRAALFCRDPDGNALEFIEPD